MPQEDTSTLSIFDSSGRQVSILNHHHDAPPPITSLLQPHPPSLPHQQDDTALDDSSAATPIRRKYVCNASGCFKSFTTSGHLARHHRIHTGEKNFPCLFPGCGSRFSRQDNMMQHYRTHMSPKSRRKKQQQQQQQQSLEDKSQPRLHAHHRIHSDTTAPLTIDQHLQKYHQSRLDHGHQSYHPSHQRIPPLSTSTSYSSSSSSITLARHTIGNLRNNTSNSVTSPSTGAPTTSIKTESSSPPLPLLLPPLQASSTVNRHSNHLPPPPSADIFYQHRPLKYTAMEGQGTHPTTLLNPTPIKTKANDTNQQDGSSPSSSSSVSSSSSNSLIPLANIVSSFG